MSAPRGWWVGLACRVCGERVKGKTDGRYTMPVLPTGKTGEPWAEHGHYGKASAA
ncbi:MAG: hypothetical protein ABWY96_06585 [Gaiellaceae bacterium]